MTLEHSPDILKLSTAYNRAIAERSANRAIDSGMKTYADEVAQKTGKTSSVLGVEPNPLSKVA